MNNLAYGLIFAVFLSFASCETTPMTTHPHHSTREPFEQSLITFYYDQSSHYLVVKTAGYCYFMALNSAEQQLVHNPDGLRGIELQAIHMMTSAPHVAMTGGDHMHVSKFVYNNLCAHEHLIKLVQHVQ